MGVGCFGAFDSCKAKTRKPSDDIATNNAKQFSYNSLRSATRNFHQSNRIGGVIGTAFALNILFNIPVWVGVLLTSFSTLLFLGIQKYGVRKLEVLIAILVLVMAGCFFGEMSYMKPPAGDILKGMFIPKLGGRGATGDAIALLGALVMPHNLFLHSALVLSRKVPNSARGVNDACRYFLIESGIALFVTFFINVSIISVSGTVCSAKNISSDALERCSDLSLDSASFLLKLHSLCNCTASFWPKFNNHWHLCRTIYNAGFLGIKDEEMAQELDNKMHSHRAKFSSFHHWWVFWSWKTNCHSIDDIVI